MMNDTLKPAIARHRIHNSDHNELDVRDGEFLESAQVHQEISQLHQRCQRSSLSSVAAVVATTTAATDSSSILPSSEILSATNQLISSGDASIILPGETNPYERMMMGTTKNSKKYSSSSSNNNNQSPNSSSLLRAWDNDQSAATFCDSKNQSTTWNHSNDDDDILASQWKKTDSNHDLPSSTVALIRTSTTAGSECGVDKCELPTIMPTTSSSKLDVVVDTSYRPFRPKKIKMGTGQQDDFIANPTLSGNNSIMSHPIERRDEVVRDEVDVSHATIGTTPDDDAGQVDGTRNSGGVVYQDELLVVVETQFCPIIKPLTLIEALHAQLKRCRDLISTTSQDDEVDASDELRDEESCGFSTDADTHKKSKKNEVKTTTNMTTTAAQVIQVINVYREKVQLLSEMTAQQLKLLEMTHYLDDLTKYECRELQTEMDNMEQRQQSPTAVKEF